jgi:stage IV sporulation protein B
LFAFSYYTLIQSIPDKLRIVAGREETFDLHVPVTGVVEDSGVEVFTNQSPKLNKENVHLNMSNAFTLKTGKQGNFSIDCKLFGFISLKEVSVEVIDEKMVVPCGVPVGIYVETDGILVIGTGAITGVDGMNYEPAYHLIKSGDYIKTVNDEVVNTKEELMAKINRYGKEELNLGIKRGEELTKIAVKAIATDKNEYKIGIWVRDDLAGVGTMTYYTKDMDYGALGHPVSDADTSTTIALGEGLLYETKIIGITKGEKGTPGELAGVIDYQKQYCLGTVSGNTQAGITGTLDRLPQDLNDASYMEVGFKQAIKPGPAKIISSVSGIRKEYEIEIKGVDFNSGNENKGIQFQVTDQELLELTGGIVQGMSGSPIIQENKLIGAVTHVFVQDAAKGYGIFIENMLNP